MWTTLVSAALVGGGAACASPIYQELDFWVGEWVVESDGILQGTNRITKILDGCAVREEWRDAEGGLGESLFYVDPRGTWKQVWVTENAAWIGGVKEKTRIAVAGPAVRFQGELPLPDGGRLLDRTTLTPHADGTVRQLIEVSRDGGATWSETFDAVYRRAGPGGLTPEGPPTSGAPRR